MAFSGALTGREVRTVLSYVAIHAFTSCAARGGSLVPLVSEVSRLSVRVSREDDNAHRIAVAPFGAPDSPIASADGGAEVSLVSCARFRPSTPVRQSLPVFLRLD